MPPRVDAALVGTLAALVSLAPLPCVSLLASGFRTKPDGVPETYAVTTLRRLPHTGEPWTQGLEFTAGGELVETSGDYPPGVGTFVRIVDPETGGEVRRITDGLVGSGNGSAGYFLEGISEMAGHWFASTYLNSVVLEYSDNFTFLGRRPFPWEGWGLAYSRESSTFLATNGSEHLLYLDPATFQAVETKVATCLGKRVAGLNELELVEDLLGGGPALVANVINTRLVLILSPATARCTGVFLLDGPDMEPVKSFEPLGYHVANGIAYDRRRGTFFVTGKNWRSLFEVRLDEAPGQRRALAALERVLVGAGPAPA
mmetsp:Transcript_69366/g.224272  ORF Transcript_69366/g.224272 Transcript_69366/m.224272 type:complete len:315 (-) Transcript_69366:24-968(-)